MPAINVCFRASNGQYLSADGGGGGPLVANRNMPGSWEIFNLTDIDGFPLQDGHRVILQTNSGLFVCAEGGGGREMSATRPLPSIWETLTILNADRSNGAITPGQRVAFRAFNGQYLSAEGGGGANVLANRNAIGQWETFTIEML
jgi:hypothetical protein